MKKVLEFLGWGIIIYVVLFFVIFLLFNGCIESGNSVGVCKDNLATKVVTYPFSSLYK